MISKKALTPKFEGINWKLNKVIFVSVHRRENWGKDYRNNYRSKVNFRKA